MSPDEEALDLFLHPGWRALIEQSEEARHALVSTAYHCRTSEELAERRGRINQLDNLLAYETLVRQQIDEKNTAKDLAEAYYE